MENSERTALLEQAFEVTHQFYVKSPPQRDFPLFEAASAWPIVCGAFVGIEITLKHLLQLGGENYDKSGRAGHDILQLYEKLNEKQRKAVDAYFRVYRSLHVNTVDPTIQDEELQSADAFIGSIARGGGGYGAWRYMLIEDPQKAPKVHVGLMLEIWRALVHIAAKIHEPLDRRLSDYVKGVVSDAADSVRWQNAVGETTVEFREVYDWFTDNGGYLAAGIILFDALYKRRETLPAASALCGRVLLDAAKETASKEAHDHELGTFHQLIRGPGLSWDAANGLFKRP